MDSESHQRAPSSSSSGWIHDVFLSFYGQDTRLGFTGHLHRDLVNKGLAVFLDEENLRRGETIRSDLLDAIRKSRYAVVIISKNYAFSSWCLDELTEIVERRKRRRLSIYPVFYMVDPSEVRKIRGNFSCAFDKHRKEKIDERRMKKWKDALKNVADISGLHTGKRKEADDVEEICEWILKKIQEIRRRSQIRQGLKWAGVVAGLGVKWGTQLARQIATFGGELWQESRGGSSQGRSRCNHPVVQDRGRGNHRVQDRVRVRDQVRNNQDHVRDQPVQGRDRGNHRGNHRVQDQVRNNQDHVRDQARVRKQVRVQEQGRNNRG